MNKFVCDVFVHGVNFDKTGADFLVCSSCLRGVKFLLEKEYTAVLSDSFVNSVFKQTDRLLFAMITNDNLSQSVIMSEIAEGGMPNYKRLRRSDVNVMFYNAVGGVEFNDEICKVFKVKAFTASVS